MARLKWSELNHLQLGRYAEDYAKMEFTSYGCDVYTAEVDDHGVDFVAKLKSGAFIEVQVKAVRKDSYTYILQNKIVLDDNHWVCYLRFIDDQLPEVYLFPATVWLYPNPLFTVRNYGQEGQTSSPEYGISCNKKNLPLLLPYTIDNFCW